MWGPRRPECVGASGRPACLQQGHSALRAHAGPSSRDDLFRGLWVSGQAGLAGWPQMRPSGPGSSERNPGTLLPTMERPGTSSHLLTFLQPERREN